MRGSAEELDDNDDIFERVESAASAQAVDMVVRDGGPVGEALRRWVRRECSKRGFDAVDFDARRCGPADEACFVALVSLSGGVDSMVMARVLGILRDACSLGATPARRTFGVACAHVNYGNRAESGRETDFLRTWCASHRIDLHVLEMPDNLRRATTPREEYEELARNARFDLYRQTRQGAAVLLGHHRGDIVENCLSNALKGAPVLELAGMNLDDTLHGVRVSRPLLRVDKRHIFDVAHALGVPYFKDTTPKWSTRGRLRTEVLPLLRDVYGEGCERNLDAVALEADALRDLVSLRIFTPFLDAYVSKSRFGYRLDARDHASEPAVFWRTVFRHLAHTLGLGALSEKALRVFVARLRGLPGVPPSDLFEQSGGGDRPPCAGWLQLKKDWLAFLDARGIFFLFAPSANRPLAAETLGTVAIDGAPQRFGAWTVRAASRVDASSDLHFEPASLDGLFADPIVAYDVPLGPYRIASQ